MLKVAHLATSLHGGAGIAAFRIHESLLEAGIHSTIITLSAPKEVEQSPNVVVLKRDPIETNLSKAVTVLQGKLAQKTTNLFTPLTIHIRETGTIPEFDVINVHNMYNLTNLKHLSDLAKRLPVVITLHDMRNFTGGCHHSCGCKKFIERNCERCPQARLGFRKLVQKKFESELQLAKSFSNIAIAAPSKWILNLVKESSMWRSRDVRLIHNPIPEIQNTNRSSARSRVNTIGFVSSDLHNPFKGFEVLTKALAMMSRDWWSSNKILLVGEGFVPEFGTFANVERVATRAPLEMAELYDRMDFLVIPSIQDNFPNVVGESTMRGTTLIVSDAGGLKEVSEIFTFARFESGNSIQLAKCLENLRMFDRTVIANKAREIFSYEKAAKSYANLYSNLSAIS
jgi:glycosyltransferase involved in cell wall biosynthesis